MKNKKTKQLLTRMSALLMTAALSITATGCGTKGEIQEIIDANSSTQINDSLVSDNTDTGADSSAMGRYVGRTVAEQESGYGEISLTKMNDGSIVIFDPYSVRFKSSGVEDGIYTSSDNGNTWNPKPLGADYDWLKDVEISYIASSKMSGDGTIFVQYAKSSDNNEPGTLKYHYMLIEPDGTHRDFDSVLSDDDKYVKHSCFDENGRLFVTVVSDNIYEIDTKDGSKSLVTSYSGSTGDYIRCHNNILMFTGRNKLVLYDMTSKSYIEDTALDNFVSENKLFSPKSVDRGFDAVAFFGDEENTIYIAFEKGLYRHIIGGSAFEQVVDGSLSAFGDPSHIIFDAIMLDNQEFLVQFSDNKTVKFSYDVNTPTVPSDKLLVYSLEENETIKQAVSVYQTQNPDVFIEYQIGMDGDAVTREDALRNLSTELLSGSGPDVLVLDGMSADTYINQGVLRDISDVVDEAEAQHGLFKNIIEPFYTGERLYMLPIEFSLPVVAGPKDVVKGAGEIKDLADLIEFFRAKSPERDLLNIASESGVLKKFASISAPLWTDEKGNINENAVREYLEQTNRIYKAQMSAMTPEMVDQYKSNFQWYLKETGVEFEDSRYFTQVNISILASSGNTFTYGEIYSMLSYANLATIYKNKGFEDIIVMPVSGKNGNIYVPKTTVGVNAQAKNSQNAVQFVSLLMGEEVQDSLYNGFPINKKSYENIFVVNPSDVADDGGYMYYSAHSEEGEMFALVTYIPTDEQRQTLKSWIEQADTPYIRNYVLEEAVYSEGGAYLLGQQDIDAAVKTIMDKVMIYVSE